VNIHFKPTSKINEIQELKVEGEISFFLNNINKKIWSIPHIKLLYSFKTYDVCTISHGKLFLKELFLFFFQKEVQEFEKIIYCTRQTTARTLNSNYNLIQPDIILKHYKHSTKIREKKMQPNAIAIKTEEPCIVQLKFFFSSNKNE